MYNGEQGAGEQSMLSNTDIICAEIILLELENAFLSNKWKQS